MLEQLLDRQRGTARPLFFLFVKLLEADRQRAFSHVDAVADFAQVVRILFIALLITCVVEMHKDSLVLKIGFQHATARESHLHRQRIFIQLKNCDVLKSIAFLFANINFSAGKLVNHLIAAEERHRITRGEVENCAAQFFLCSWCDLHVQPRTDRREDEGNTSKRNTDARDAHAVRAQRDQFIIGGKPAEDEQDRG